MDSKLDRPTGLLNAAGNPIDNDGDGPPKATLAVRVGPGHVILDIGDDRPLKLSAATAKRLSKMLRDAAKKSISKRR